MIDLLYITYEKFYLIVLYFTKKNCIYLLYNLQKSIKSFSVIYQKLRLKSFENIQQFYELYELQNLRLGKISN